MQTISEKLNIKLTILADEIIHSDKLPEINVAQPTENILTGNSWLISANGNLYDHEGAFNKFGYINWRQNNRSYQGENSLNKADWLKKSKFQYLFSERLKALEEQDPEHPKMFLMNLDKKCS